MGDTSLLASQAFPQQQQPQAEWEHFNWIRSARSPIFRLPQKFENNASAVSCPEQQACAHESLAGRWYANGANKTTTAAAARLFGIDFSETKLSQ